MVCYHLRLRFERYYMAAFISSARVRKVVMATSSESLLQDKKKQRMSLDSAELVGRALAERMKAKCLHKAKFDMKREFADKDPRYHDYITTIAVALSQNGITLY